jgi:hypothetical protein
LYRQTCSLEGKIEAVQRIKPQGASAAPFLQVFVAPGGATNAPSRKEGDVETLFHVLGCVFYTVATVYYIIALVKLARFKERE